MRHRQCGLRVRTSSRRSHFPQNLGIRGASTSYDFWGVGARIATFNSLKWDTIYDKCFVELRWQQDGLVQRIAQVTHAELMAWMQANAPQSGGSYTSDCLLTAYEVVSPAMRIARTMTMHRLYGAMKGRKSYFGNYGRGDPETGLYRQAGYGTRFTAHFTGAATLTRDLITEIWGGAPGTEEPRVVWFPSACPTNTYRISKGQMYMVQDALNGRMCWDAGTNTYVDAPQGSYQQDGNVRWLYLEEPSGTVLNIIRMSNSLTKGSAFVWENLGVVVLIPILSASNNDLKAMVAYPMGVTHLTINIPQSLGEVCDTVFLNNYGPSAHGVYPVLVPGGTAQNPTADLFRFPLGSILHLLGAPGTPKRRSLDFEGIPSSVTFYLRHPVTGLRSALADRQVVKVMRKNNAALAWNEASLLG